MGAKSSLLLLCSLTTFACKESVDFKQIPNSLIVDSIRCDQILNEITIKNQDSDPVILLNTASPSIERNYSEARLGYFFGSNKEHKNSEDQSKSIALVQPGKSLKLKIGEDFENINWIDTFHVTIGYQKIEKGKFGETGLRISQDLFNSQSIQEFEIDCRDLSKL